MADAVKRVLNSVREAVAKLKTEKPDTESESTEEAFRVVLRTLDELAPWPKQYSDRFDDIRRATKTALAVFRQGKVEKARQLLEDLL